MAKVGLPLTLILVRHGPRLIHRVAPLLNVGHPRQKLIAPGAQLGIKLSIELRPQFGVRGLINQVIELIGIGCVVVEQPRAVERADIGVLPRAQAAVLTTALLPRPLAERDADTGAAPRRRTDRRRRAGSRRSPAPRPRQEWESRTAPAASA